MKEWILSIGAVAVISAIIGLIIPDGRTGKLIKWFCSITVIMVVISPIKNLKTVDVNLFEKDVKTVLTDENYMNFTIGKKIENIEKKCIETFENKGIKDVKVYIEYSVEEDYSYIIKNVVINLENSVMNSYDEHIVIIEECKTFIAEYLNIDKGAISVNG